MKSISLAVPKSILVCASSPITISVASKEVIAVIAPDAPRESTYALTDCCVGTRVAELVDISSSSTNAVMVIVPSPKLPKVIVSSAASPPT